MKKLLYFIGVLVLISAIVGVGYWLSKKNPGVKTEVGGGGLILPENTETGGGLPENTGAGGLTENTTTTKKIENVFDFKAVSENELVYMQTSGKIFREKGGVVEELNNTEVSNLQDVGFSADGSFLLVRSGERNAPQSSVFDAKNKSFVPLQEKIIAYSWSPSGQNLAYLAQAQGGNDLLVKDFSGAKNKARKITTLHATDVSLSWIAEDKLVLSEKTSAFTTGSAWIINPSSATTTQLFPDQLGLRVLWDGVSDQGLIWSGNRAQRGGELWLVGSGQRIVQKFNFLTIPSKCALNTEIIENATSTTKKVGGKTVVATSTIRTVGETGIYCGVPKNQRQLKINPIPDYYEQRGFYTEDDLYKIDAKSGSIKTLPWDGGLEVDVSKISVAGKKIFLLNRYNKELIELSRP